jgi:hypothetical protein
MEAAAQLAGFIAAHGIWCVLDSGPLIPILAFETAEGRRMIQRLAAAELEQGVSIGRNWLEDNRAAAIRAVLVYDGFITLASGKIDALLLDIREYCPTPRSLSMAIPFRPATSEHCFSVHRPKFLSCNFSNPDYQALGSAFFRGVDSHEKGAAIWNRHLDQSL